MGELFGMLVPLEDNPTGIPDVGLRDDGEVGCTTVVAVCPCPFVVVKVEGNKADGEVARRPLVIELLITLIPLEVSDVGILTAVFPDCSKVDWNIVVNVLPCESINVEGTGTSSEVA